MWFISRSILGSQRHLLVINGSIAWSDILPDDALGYALPDFHPRALSRFLTIAGRPAPKLLPENIEKSLLVSQIPLAHAGASYLLRPQNLRKCVDQFVTQVEGLLEMLSQYQKTYITGAMTLAQCQPAKYSRECLERLNVGKKIILDREGFATKSTYSLSDSKTGRMTVVAGPQILTCSRDVKKCIRSRFTGGSIVEIDFSALEPRTALAVIGSPLATSPDIYAEVAQLFSPALSRDIAKQVTISFLYGAAKNTIRHLVGAVDQIDEPLNNLRQMFGFDAIVDRGIAEIREQGFFRNHAGRPIFPQSSKRGLIFNNFCQSTAVDVALSGFSRLLNYIAEKECSAVPLYFIHDALILDVPPDEVELIQGEGKLLQTYLGINFPTKIKILHN